MSESLDSEFRSENWLWFLLSSPLLRHKQCSDFCYVSLNFMSKNVHIRITLLIVFAITLAISNPIPWKEHYVLIIKDKWVSVL